MIEWRCFHCGKAFTDAAEAEVHFGPTQHATPACQIPDGLEALRAAERRVAELLADKHEADIRWPTWARNVQFEPLLKEATEYIRKLLEDSNDHTEAARNFVAAVKSAFRWN